MKGQDVVYTGDDPYIYSYRDSCIYTLFCGASYVSALPKLAGPPSCYRIWGGRSLLRQIYAVSALMFKVRRWKK
jgi:hypothetical protein